MVFRFLDKYRDAGLLILRAGIGIMFMLHVSPKLISGSGRYSLGGQYQPGSRY